jgi:hypothetical protein
VIPPRPTFAADMTGTKSAIMSKHVAYWTDLLDKDIAVAGRRAIGLVRTAVVEAPNEQEVRILAERDPVIPESVTVMPPSRDHPNGRPSRPRKP